MVAKEIVFYRGKSYGITRLCALLGVGRTRIHQLIEADLIHRRIDEAEDRLEDLDDVDRYEMGE